MDRRNFITQSGRLLALAGAVPSATAPSALSGLKEQTNVPLTSIHRIEADGLTVFEEVAVAMRQLLAKSAG